MKLFELFSCSATVFKKSLSLFTACFLIGLGVCTFSSCYSQVHFEEAESQDTTPQDTSSKDFVTTAAVSTLLFFRQNTEGSMDLSTYEKDTSTAAKQYENVSIAKGTSLSSLENQLSSAAGEGFSYYTAVQAGSTLNIYFNRTQVTYRFYDAFETETCLYTISGLYGAEVDSPSYSSENYFFIKWVTKDSSACLGKTYGTSDLSFIPSLVLKSRYLGTKFTPDTEGDLLLKDGSAIPFEDYVGLEDEKKAALKAAARGVVICTTYNPLWNERFTETDTTHFYEGSEILVASFYNDDYMGLPWAAGGVVKSEAFYLSFSDGLENQKTLDDADFSGENLYGHSSKMAATAVPYLYGKNYWSLTDYESSWYLPSLNEIFVMAEFYQKRPEILKEFPLPSNGNWGTFWSSTTPESSSDTLSNGCRTAYYFYITSYSQTEPSSWGYYASAAASRDKTTIASGPSNSLLAAIPFMRLESK